MKASRLIFTILLGLYCGTMYSQTYSWSNVAFGGGGFVSSIITSPKEQNLIYCRTDVGGAYRWIESTQSWKPLLDWVADDQVGFQGVEALAIDPTTPANVYMLVGLSYFNSGKTAILRSSDYGETFSFTEVTSQFKAHGNGMGRQNGERLAVDPNNGSILFCGTRRNGLFTSTDGGVKWANVAAFPVTTTSNDNGICFVLFDKSTGTTGNATQTIYAGVSRSGSSNIYVSTNGGTSWTAVSGQPTTYMPQRAALASDGYLYITYGDAAGPNDPSNGQVWKYYTKTPGWTNITPTISGVSMGFGGVSVDASNASKIVVTTMNKYLTQPSYPGTTSTPWGDRIFVSTNGGSSWTDLIGSSKFAYSNNGTPWINGYAIHWAGSIEIDPFNSSRVFLASGNGIFMTENLSTTATSTWKFNVKGLEETVPLDVVSIPSGPLVSVVGDYDGCTYASPTTYYALHSPAMGTSTGVAFASKKTTFVVRAGGYSDGTNIPMYYSSNTGSTWTAISTKPYSGAYQGRICVNADGTAILWCPSGSSTTYKSTNNGTSWTSTGLSISGAIPVADQVNANKIYTYNSSSGTVYVSTNAGTSFSAGATVASGGSMLIRTAPGVEGDIWIPLYAGGLTRSTNSGSSFTKLSNVATCSSVGFGKIATGKTYPTVFIWGTVGGVLGIFKSTDAGSTWTRVNDDSHEWGGPGNGNFVIGDMNTEGRVYMSTVGRGIVMGEIATPGCKTPSLGLDTVSVCGLTLPYTLNSNTTTATNVTYKWYKDGNVISGATSPTYQLTSATNIAGLYKVQRDSLTCSQTDQVVITSTLPKPAIGVDQELCSALSATLDANVTGTGMTYQWSYNGAAISGATAKTYTTTTPGTYICANSASNCATRYDTVIVTSKLLSITPDTICAAGKATLTVTSTGSTYEWYNASTGGTALATGATYQPTISATTTYYVKDAGGQQSTIGIAAKTSSSTGWDANGFTELTTQLNVIVTQPITLLSVSVYVQTANSSVTIRFMQGTTVAYSYTATNVSSGLQEIPVNFALAAGSYTMDAVGTTSSLYLQSNNASFPYSLANYISFSNAQSWATTYYGMFYNWKLKIASTCVRTPVTAVINASSAKCVDTDGDGTPDITDGCPADKNKTAAGQCGCGNLETDSDSDGIADCVDGCPLDPDKTTPGICGCGKAEGTCNLIQTLTLDQGWNLVSFYVTPASTAVASVFGDLGTNLLCVKTMDAFYAPAQPSFANSLLDIAPGAGYYVQVQSQATLSVTGDLSTETSYTLKSGWNLVGYPKKASSVINTVAAPVLSNLNTIKTFEGFWMPGGALNSVTEFVPGKGYLINAQSSASLQW